jgi:hypothetical protein
MTAPANGLLAVRSEALARRRPRALFGDLHLREDLRVGRQVDVPTHQLVHDEGATQNGVALIGGDGA